MDFAGLPDRLLCLRSRARPNGNDVDDAPHAHTINEQAPTQELRLKIVPSAKAFPLEKLMQACYDHVAASKKALFVEYVLVRTPKKKALR